MTEIKVELIDHMGSDLTVVNAARVSFDKTSKFEYNNDFNSEEEAEVFAQSVGGQIDYEYVYSDHWFGGYPVEYLSTRDQKLIKYLAKHNHIAPFQHPQIILRETVPIFVARQRFKSVVGFTYSEISRRYVDDEPEFYVPDTWRKRAEDKKQGSSDEVVENLSFVGRFDDGAKVSDHYNRLIDHAVEVYGRMIDSGVAPEQARMILPQSMLTSYYCTGSLAAFARAYKLRSYPDAQKEIRDLAEQWDKIIRPLFPHSWSALVD